jgi:3-oxoacyl-[acyl-carrier-protein] synthase-3
MAEFDIDESFLVEKIGMQRLAVKSSEEETSDLCCKAFADLQLKTGLKLEEVDCIVLCTQNPDGNGLPHTSAVVHGKLGLPETCSAFDISLGCSGYVYGLSVLQGFMQANGFSRGVLFTADPYSKIINKNDKNTSLLFGDAATATLLSEAPTWRMGKPLFGTSGKDAAAIEIERGNAQLSMNGRAVFSFSATSVPKNIAAMLDRNQLSVDDIDCFVLHQGSRYIVETLRKKLGVDAGRAPFVAADYGNTVSSSIPLQLIELTGGTQCVVIAGFGVGLSWGSSVLFAM